MFDSPAAREVFDLPVGRDKEWIAFGRDDVAKLDPVISWRQLEFCSSAAWSDSASDAQQFLVRRQGINPSFVRRQRGAGAAMEWYVVPAEHSTPFRLARGDRLYIAGLLAEADDPTVEAPLTHEPKGLKYEYVVELPEEQTTPAVVAAQADTLASTANAALPGLASPAAEAPLTLARALADLEQIPDERNCGLRAIDRACELGRALELRAAELRIIEHERGVRLVAAQAELHEAMAEYNSREAALFADAAQLLSAKHRKLVQVRDS
jgi:hypothetical protein